MYNHGRQLGKFINFVKSRENLDNKVSYTFYNHKLILWYTRLDTFFPGTFSSGIFFFGYFFVATFFSKYFFSKYFFLFTDGGGRPDGDGTVLYYYQGSESKGVEKFFLTEIHRFEKLLTQCHEVSAEYRSSTFLENRILTRIRI